MDLQTFNGILLLLFLLYFQLSKPFQEIRMSQGALVNNLFVATNSKSETTRNVLLVLGGTLFLALMSQLSFKLSFTPVPITGQTFAVVLIGLTYGRKLAASTLATYLLAGTAGLPSGGYLIGFFFSAVMCGHFADKGWTKSPFKLAAIMLMSHVIIFACGLAQLSLFVPAEKLLAFGWLPFLPGDVVKSAAVIALLPTAWKFVRNKE